MKTVNALSDPPSTEVSQKAAAGVRTRGIGYCLNNACDEYHEKVFVLNLKVGDAFRCSRCAVLGATEIDQGIASGEGKFFREARVEYCFDPENKSYLCVAIVTDNCMEGNKTYTLRSTVITTEKRALKVAEVILSNLNVYNSYMEDGTPDLSERILDIDRGFLEEMKKLSKSWERFSKN